MKRSTNSEPMKKCVIIVKPKVQGSAPMAIQLAELNKKLAMKPGQEMHHRRLTGKLVQDSQDILADVGIQGINKIFNRNYSVFGKLIWSIAIISCFVFCVIQVSKRINHYMKVPYNLAMDLERERVAEFPAVTVCPFYPFDYNKKLWQMVEEYYAMHPNKSYGLNYFLNVLDLPNVTATDIWNLGAVNHSYAGIICQVLSTKKNCHLSVKSEQFTTYLGVCAKYQLSEVLQYDGPYNGMKLEFLNHDNEDGTGVQYMAIVHHPDDDYKHLVYKNGGVYLQEYSWMQIKFSVKKYYRYNTPSRSCQTRREVSHCLTECIERYIVKNITCRLPYIREDCGRPMCDTAAKANHTYQHTINVYENTDYLCRHCSKPCLEIFYNGFDTILDRTPNQTRVSLYYHDNVAEIIREIPVYTFDVLLADVGGSLGLFLGVCLLSVMQLMESICVVLKKRMMKLM